MKVEDPSALDVQWFYHKSKVLPKGDESSWQNCIKFAARNTTTKRVSIAMEKMLMDTKNISVKIAGISGRRMPRRGRLAALGRKSIQSVLCAGKRCTCITIKSTTPTIPAQTGSVGTPFLCRSLRLFQPHPYPNCSARRISNECVILSM